jgi:hypothetical protein
MLCLARFIDGLPAKKATCISDFRRLCIKGKQLHQQRKICIDNIAYQLPKIDFAMLSHVWKVKGFDKVARQATKLSGRDKSSPQQPAAESSEDRSRVSWKTFKLK